MDCAVAMVTEQVPVPEHPPPLHPEKVEPEAAEAVRVTFVAGSKEALQVDPQLIPAGLLVTVPEPVPAFVTLNVLLDGGAVASNFAVMVAAELMTMQLP